MNVEFIAVMSEKLDTVPVIDGQIIGLMNEDNCYYDMGGKRRKVASIEYVTKVSTTPTVKANKVFFTGTQSPESSIEELVKVEGVYVDSSTGKLTAGGFIGNATSATKAVTDNINQTIDSTYIKNASVSGQTLTFTRGDNKTFQITTQDTHWVSKLVVGASNTASTNAVATNGNVHLNLFDNSTKRESHKIVGSGSVTVTSDANGNITVTGVNTTYAETTDTTSGLFTPAEKRKLAALSEGTSVVSYSQSITSGTKIGAITINGKATDIYYDNKVKQNVTTANANYPLLLAPSGQTATGTAEAHFDSGVTLNPSTNTIAANITGNAGTSDQLKTGRTIKLTGAITGEVSFNGTADVEIETDVNHTHLEIEQISERLQWTTF